MKSFTIPELFQSTPPARGATNQERRKRELFLFQSTPPARGATTVHYGVELVFDVSIHAPRAGGDL